MAEDSLNDSIETSVSMGLFKNRRASASAHQRKTSFMLPMSMFKNVDNFNPNRLKDTAIEAYPKSDRPRGADDISSVNYLVSQIERGNTTPSIYVLKKGNKYTLLDGAHRLVAHHIAKSDYINAFVVEA
jgi:hypothetical protein